MTDQNNTHPRATPPAWANAAAPAYPTTPRAHAHAAELERMRARLDHAHNRAMLERAAMEARHRRELTITAMAGAVGWLALAINWLAF